MSQNNLRNRILELRKNKGWSQSELATQVGISYAQIGRYETKDAQPPAEVIKKLADALDTSVDYLLFGSTADKASAALQDAEVIRYFKEIELMPADDKAALLKVIAAFIRDNKAKQAYAR